RLAYCWSTSSFHIVEIATGRDVALPVTECGYSWVGEMEMIRVGKVVTSGLTEGEDLEATVEHLDLNTLRTTRVDYKEPRSTFYARFPVIRYTPRSQAISVVITDSLPSMNPFRFATDSSGAGMYVSSKDGKYNRVFFRHYWTEDMLVTSDMQYVIWRD